MTNATTYSNISYEIRSRPVVPEPPLYILLLASVLYATIFSVGVFGNIIVITVVVRFRRLRSRMMYFFANLSVTDLLVLVVCLPSAAVDLYAKEVWYFGSFMCVFVPYLENTVAIASVLTILAVSYDRYRGICHPMDTECFWKRINVAIVIALTWFVAGVSGIPLLFIVKFKESKFIDGTDIEVCRIRIDKEWKAVYILLIFSVCFVGSFIILVYLIARMSYSLLQNMTQILSVTNQEFQKKIRNRKRVVIMLILVIIMFFLCLLPQRIVGIWLIFAKRGDLARLGFERYLNLLTFSRVALFLNSCMNPIIYNAVSGRFKAAVRYLICRTLPSQHDDLFSNSVNGSIANQTSDCRYKGDMSLEMSRTPPQCRYDLLDDRRSSEISMTYCSLRPELHHARRITCSSLRTSLSDDEFEAIEEEFETTPCAIAQDGGN